MRRTCNGSSANTGTKHIAYLRRAMHQRDRNECACVELAVPHAIVIPGLREPSPDNEGTMPDPRVGRPQADAEARQLRSSDAVISDASIEERPTPNVVARCDSPSAERRSWQAPHPLTQQVEPARRNFVHEMQTYEQ